MSCLWLLVSGGKLHSLTSLMFSQVLVGFFIAHPRSASPRRNPGVVSTEPFGSCLSVTVWQDNKSREVRITASYKSCSYRNREFHMRWVMPIACTRAPAPGPAWSSALGAVVRGTCLRVSGGLKTSAALDRRIPKTCFPLAPLHVYYWNNKSHNTMSYCFRAAQRG